MNWNSFPHLGCRPSSRTGPPLLSAFMILGAASESDTFSSFLTGDFLSFWHAASEHPALITVVEDWLLSGLRGPEDRLGLIVRGTSRQSGGL